MEKILKSYAKVNLYLEVLEKRSDGFHEIESIFQLVSLHDVLKIKPSNSFFLTISPESSPFAFKEDLTKNNLLEKVYRYFAEHYEISPISIELVKKIPIGAGLGGGSSNAACLMLYLNESFSLGLSPARLREIGLQFGSDIPFFFGHQSALARGRGELVEPITISKDAFDLFILYPDVHISTKEAYERYACLGKGPGIADLLYFLKEKRKRNDLKKNEKLFYNAFEAKLLPSLDAVKSVFDGVRECQCLPLLSGSGSSVLALCEKGSDKKELGTKLRGCAAYVYDVGFVRT